MTWRLYKLVQLRRLSRNCKILINIKLIVQLGRQAWYINARSSIFSNNNNSLNYIYKGKANTVIQCFQKKRMKLKSNWNQRYKNAISTFAAKYLKQSKSLIRIFFIWNNAIRKDSITKREKNLILNKQDISRKDL